MFCQWSGHSQPCACQHAFYRQDTFIHSSTHTFSHSALHTLLYESSCHPAIYCSYTLSHHTPSLNAPPLIIHPRSSHTLYQSTPTLNAHPLTPHFNSLTPHPPPPFLCRQCSSLFDMSHTRGASHWQQQQQQQRQY